MSLYTRLIGIDAAKNRIPIEILMAMIREVARGKMTRAEIATQLGLDAGEEGELTALIARGLTADELGDILRIAEHSRTTQYRTEAALKTRLGV